MVSMVETNGNKYVKMSTFWIGRSQCKELYAVCAHLGRSMECGHYIAFINTGPSLQHEAVAKHSTVLMVGRQLQYTFDKQVGHAEIHAFPLQGRKVVIWAPGDRRFWSMFPLTRVPFWVHIFDTTAILLSA